LLLNVGQHATKAEMQYGKFYAITEEQKPFLLCTYETSDK
jgi:hypothetical protein